MTAHTTAGHRMLRESRWIPEEEAERVSDRVWTSHGVTIREFPLAVTPGLRLPVYHTLRYFTNETRFLTQLDQFVDGPDPAGDHVIGPVCASPAMREPGSRLTTFTSHRTKGTPS